MPARQDSAYSESFIEFAEAVINDVAQWGAEYVQTVVAALMPDGRPFGQKKLNEQEQLDLYMEIRSDPAKWDNWLDERIMRVQEQLQQSGLDQDTIAAVHPENLVASAALVYSIKMERLLDEEEKLAREHTLPDMLNSSERLVPSLPVEE